MTVDLTREMIIHMIKGTGGPGNYASQKYGSLYGFPNERWQWNDKYLANLMDTQLMDLYHEIVNSHKN